MEVTLGLTATQDSSSHEELYLPEVQVSESVVPTEQFFFWFRQVQVVVVNRRESY